jgi:hypothetical protein
MSEHDYLQIIINGQWFYPAWKHYGNDTICVSCSRCNTSNLNVVVGYINKDLCLKCAQVIVEINNVNKTQNIYIPTTPLPNLPIESDSVIPSINTNVNKSILSDSDTQLSIPDSFPPTFNADIYKSIFNNPPKSFNQTYMI